MNKFILGSGLAGLLARDILGGEWTIVPFTRSRFFTFTPALDDNYIIRDDSINEYVSKYATIPLVHKSVFSYGGQLTYNHALCVDQWLNKVYGPGYDGRLKPYLKSRSEVWGCGNCISIYHDLMNRYKDEIAANINKFNNVSKINDHELIANNVSYEADAIVSCIPLYKLYELMSINIALDSADVWYYHLRTDCLDFEGATNMLVVDDAIDFHKVVKLDEINYIFMSKSRILYPGQYFMAFMKKFDLVGEVCVKRAIPCGIVPDQLTDVVCIGKTAAWDDCLDIGSCIKRLLMMRT